MRITSQTLPLCVHSPFTHHFTADGLSAAETNETHGEPDSGRPRRRWWSVDRLVGVMPVDDLDVPMATMTGITAHTY